METDSEKADRYFREQCESLGPIEGLPIPEWKPKNKNIPLKSIDEMIVFGDPDSGYKNNYYAEAEQDTPEEAFRFEDFQ